MDGPGAKGREAPGNQPPPGYPTETPTDMKPVDNRTMKRGDEKGFIEGCLAALCCCWICETCCF